MTDSIEPFIGRIDASGLLSKADVQQLVDGLPPAEKPRDVQQLARLLVKRGMLTAYQAKQIYAGKGKSLVLGNYVVLDKLGQGGMGMVLKAEHKRMRRLVALKVLAPAAMKSPDAVQRFHREVEAAARLEHPNIVPAYDADEANGTHFFVMQYVEGKDLSILVKEKGPLSADKAISCVTQAARGLEFAHSKGVVHRDIKPANLLLDKQGTVKILDMGLARLESSIDDPTQAELTSTGQIMGTVDFMAPEQAMSTKAADARSDIYSLGITLWYLMTGKAAYDGDTLMAKLMAHQQAPLPSLCEVCPEAPAELDAIFQKMVAKKPEDRHQTMGEVIAELQSWDGSASSSPSLSFGSSEDSKLSEFLGGISKQPGTKVARAVAVQTKVATELSETIDIQPSAADTDPQTQTLVPDFAATQLQATKPKASPPRKRNRKALVGAGAGGMACCLLAAIVFFFPTPNGTLRIEIEDPQIEVSIKGAEIVLKGASDEEITLTPGEHILHVERGDFKFDTDALILKKGETVTVKVAFLDQKIVLEKDGQRQAFSQPKTAPVTDLAMVPKAASGKAPKPASGKSLGYALQFNVDSELDKPHSVSVPTLKDTTPSLTIELWTQRNTSLWHGADFPRAHRWIAGFDPVKHLGTDSGGALAIRDRDDESGGPDTTIQSPDWRAGVEQPVHLAFVRDAPQSEVRFFVDGKLIDSRKAPITQGRDSFGLLTHQWQGDSKDFGYMGWIDEVRISSVPRYRESFTPQIHFETDTDTLALYHCDEGQGDVLKDSSGNGHDGQIVGAKWIKLDASTVR